jgi:hypothetical protein
VTGFVGALVAEPSWWPPRWAITLTVILRPFWAAFSTSEFFGAPLIALPFAYHWYAYDVAAGLHVPFDVFRGMVAHRCDTGFTVSARGRTPGA